VNDAQQLQQTGCNRVQCFISCAKTSNMRCSTACELNGIKCCQQHVLQEMLVPYRICLPFFGNGVSAAGNDVQTINKSVNNYDCQMVNAAWHRLHTSQPGKENGNDVFPELVVTGVSVSL